MRDGIQPGQANPAWIQPPDSSIQPQESNRNIPELEFALSPSIQTAYQNLIATHSTSSVQPLVAANPARIVTLCGVEEHVLSSQISPAASSVEACPPGLWRANRHIPLLEFVVTHSKQMLVRISNRHTFQIFASTREVRITAGASGVETPVSRGLTAWLKPCPDVGGPRVARHGSPGDVEARAVIRQGTLLSVPKRTEKIAASAAEGSGVEAPVSRGLTAWLKPCPDGHQPLAFVCPEVLLTFAFDSPTFGTLRKPLAGRGLRPRAAECKQHRGHPWF